MDKKVLALAIVATILLCTTVYGFTSRTVILLPTHYKVVEEKHYTYIIGGQGSDVAKTTISIEAHASLKQWRWIDGEKYLIYSYSHPANITHFGCNHTAAKLTGHTTWNLTAYMYNKTDISLGHDVGLDWNDNVLPGEWNRTAGTFEYLGVGNWNYSASFYPSGSGVTNSTGLNISNGTTPAPIGKTFTLIFYDTFADISYTSNDQIDVEWNVKVQAS